MLYFGRTWLHEMPTKSEARTHPRISEEREGSAMNGDGSVDCISETVSVGSDDLHSFWVPVAEMVEEGVGRLLTEGKCAESGCVRCRYCHECYGHIDVESIMHCIICRTCHQCVVEHEHICVPCGRCGCCRRHTTHLLSDACCICKDGEMSGEGRGNVSEDLTVV